MIHVIFSDTNLQLYLHTSVELCYVMCYVIKTLGMKGLVTMNNLMTILGIDPKFGLSTFRSNCKILAIN